MNSQQSIARSKAIQADIKAKAAASLPPSNRKLADRLADAKRARDDAQTLYDVLRDQVVAAGGSVGDDFVATVTARTTSRADKKKLEARFGKQAVAECCNTSTAHYVEIKARTDNPFG